MLAECCVMSSHTIVETVFMGGESLFEGSLSQSDISLLSTIVISMDCCLVYDRFI